MANPIIRKDFTIGNPDAESDEVFLKECFTDTGALNELLDCSNSRCIVLGRTGSGKTALQKELVKRAEHAREMTPETLSLNYISNSKTIAYFEELGVNLELFYKLLWQHVLVIELLKLKFDIRDEPSQIKFFAWLGSVFRDASKVAAFDYLRKYGDKFWTDTSLRTKEFTEKIETELAITGKVTIAEIGGGASGARKLSEERKIEVRDHAQRAVASIQLEDLNRIIDLLSEEIFVDEKKHYYIVIDKLDEDWVDDTIRFKLIRALIDAVRTLRRIPNAKITMALRTDLLESVLARTSGPGFQREKYVANYLNLKWSRDELVEMLNRRVRFLFRRQYTQANVTASDILANTQIDKRSPLEYIIDRTFFRPREAIMFINQCIAEANGSSRITRHNITAAEVAYSSQRIDSLYDEWSREFPALKHCVKFFIHKTTPIEMSEIDKEWVSDFCLAYLSDNSNNSDPVLRFCATFFDNEDRQRFLRNFFSAMYKVGIIGIKLAPHTPRHWSHDDLPTIEPDRIGPTASIDVHKTFWMALGVTTKHHRPPTGK